ncbi:MAG: response regulator transcription factor [Anaerolineae bacterium]|nr:response regulator transcription factor [Chloroflexota bacterium]MBN8637033.1 response regulator transcription factor [Anaerolineae bacterium]
MTMSTIRIVVVDDHEMVRRGLATFLRTSPDFVLVGEAANGQEAIERCRELLPNVVLMDLMMPEMDGFTAIALLREQLPDVRVIALSSSNDALTVATAARAGAVGYLSKSISNDELATAIRAAAEGKPAFSAHAIQALIEVAMLPPEPRYNLTERELSVVRLLVEGKNNIEIARLLNISRSTVKYHVSAIIAKLGVSNRAEAVAVALKHKLI